MANSIFQSDGPASRTPESVVASVVKDARQSYGDAVDETTLSVWAENAVTELWGESVKVTSFLPVLAMREIAVQVTEHKQDEESEAAG